jgi:prephenate dehydrogenase
MGLGLIGGSLLRRLAATHNACGYDVNPAARAAAADAGLRSVPTVEDAVGTADLVIVAAPLPAFARLVPAVAKAARPGTLISDVASVKVAPRELVRAHANGLRYVGGHPMAGTEHSGFAASDPHLFDGAPWVLCLDPDTDLGTWLELARLVTGLGCRVVPTTAEEHDGAVARISHLPHLLAAALAAGADGNLARKLAAGSFRDGTRVAGTRPDLVATMCDGNREAVIGALDRLLDRLAEARDALRAGESVRPLAREGYTARQRWVGFGMGGGTVELDAGAATLRADLLRLGRVGGHLDEVGDGLLLGWRPAP